MIILKKFEKLVEQDIFCCNKKDILQSIGLSDLLSNRNNQQIRAILTNNKDSFADMSRVIR